MRDSPSQQEMEDPENPQGGTPNYIDKSSETANTMFYPSRGQDASAYKASNPRYWEYR